MSDYLLLGTRPRVSEVSPCRIAHDIVALQAWHDCLRRWGLQRSFALPTDPSGEFLAGLVVQASGYRAAERLAAWWGGMSGYRVSVLRLCGARPERERAR